VRISLTQFHRQLRNSGAGALLVTAVAMALFLALTPCCEVNAAISAPTPIGSDVHADAQDNGHDHGGAPFSSDTCAAWANDNPAVFDGSALLLTAESDVSMPWIGQKESETRDQAPVPLPPSLHSPPSIPIYLQYAHLLF